MPAGAKTKWWWPDARELNSIVIVMEINRCNF
jgi:hypothetical protein